MISSRLGSQVLNRYLEVEGGTLWYIPCVHEWHSSGRARRISFQIQMLRSSTTWTWFCLR